MSIILCDQGAQFGRRSSTVPRL